jgi:N-methylhydantoinase A
MLTIGRQARRELYALQPQAPPPPVPPELCLETGGRLAADGSVLEPLTAGDLSDLRAALSALAPEAVAINLLFSHLDDRPERAVADAVPGAPFVSRSSEILPLQGEYERGIATWLNARVGPVVGGYLDRLRAALAGARVAVMQSSGETVAAAQGARQAVRLLLSGPAGGLVGAGYVGRAAGVDRLLTFDMGGTSTDVALVDGAPRLTTAGRIAGWPVAVPMVDMHTIGAGGGSIARLDPGGALLVGPESAGADPGPVCYGNGGIEPTVTDANLVLGRLPSDAFLGGRMKLDRDAARNALRRLGLAMGLPAARAAERAAEGVVAVANEHMARALRVISVQRGIDPRSAHLCSFGGAGGLHVCALAEALGMARALVPERAGVLSALGMLVTPPGRLLVRTRLGLLEGLDEAELASAFGALARQGQQSLAREGVEPSSLTREYSVDLRYRGQSYTLNLSWRGRSKTADAFHALHRARYGHLLDLPVELVNLRVRLTAEPYRLTFPPASVERAAPQTTHVAGLDRPVPMLRRAAIGSPLTGPAVILDDVATTWLAPGWRASRDRAGNLLLSRSGAYG